MNEKELIAFEKDIRDNYEQAKIRAPVHLCGGNEKQLIQIFENVKPEDWVFSTHRSHYHALLKSNDKEWVREQIFLKRSSHINSCKYKVFTSAIVGGICPIALGVALAIKRKRAKGQVWAFVGDMASEMGIFHECLKYARGEDLPITFVIEDNGLGVETPTSKVWKERTMHHDLNKIDGYIYKRVYPHYGIGKWITF